MSLAKTVSLCILLWDLNTNNKMLTEKFIWFLKLFKWHPFYHKITNVSVLLVRFLWFTATLSKSRWRSAVFNCPDSIWCTSKGIWANHIHHAASLPLAKRCFRRRFWVLICKFSCLVFLKYFYYFYFTVNKCYS